jgi:hypothetical protein
MVFLGRDEAVRTKQAANSERTSQRANFRSGIFLSKNAVCVKSTANGPERFARTECEISRIHTAERSNSTGGGAAYFSKNASKSCLMCSPTSSTFCCGAAIVQWPKQTQRDNGFVPTIFAFNFLCERR